MKSQVFMWHANMMSCLIIASGVGNVTTAVKSAMILIAAHTSLQS